MTAEEQAELAPDGRRLYQMKQRKPAMFAELLEANQKMLADEQANLTRYTEIRDKTAGIENRSAQKLAIKKFCC